MTVIDFSISVFVYISTLVQVRQKKTEARLSFIDTIKFQRKEKEYFLLINFF